MPELSLSLQLGLLLFFIFASGFFSASETSMMAINRYRLRHMAQKKHRAAQRVSDLLERPDRLIGVILLGNNFVNILASSIATLLAIELAGESAIPVAAALLTVVILLFSEVTPKTIAALHPERIAFPASIIIKPLLILLYPLVWVLNSLGNVMLRVLGVYPEQNNNQRLTSEELRTIVHEAEGFIPKRRQQMLLGILDLEKATVEDIMVPRNEIIGIDINSPPEELLEQLANAQHTRLPLYRDNIDSVIGMLHARKILRFLQHPDLFTHAELEANAKEVYFVPEGTPLNTQLLNFQRHKRRIGLVVNEYGEIQGLVTLEDILEEIVGEFTTTPDVFNPDIHFEDDTYALVDGSISIRDLNRNLNLNFPTEGPKTLNGLILDHLEAIPEAGTSLRLQNHLMEIMQVTNNSVKTVRITKIPSSGLKGTDG